MSLVEANEDRWAALERRMAQIEGLLSSQVLVESADFARAATYAPPIFRLLNDEGKFRSQHYSPYWRDPEVRRLMIALHRQLSLDGALAAIRAEVGEDRTPSKSALGRIWKQLDKARGAA